MAAARKRRSGRSSATRCGTRAPPRLRSARGSLPASPDWVSRRMFPSCAASRPVQPISNRDRAGHQRGLGPDASRARSERGGVPRRPAPRIIWTTSITVFEVRLGLDILAAGQRRRQLEDAFGKVLEEDFEGRVLPFDQVAAQAAGRIAAERRHAGRAVEVRDLQIAGIVNARKATLATRNTRHFEACGLTLVDPWSV